MDRELGAAIRTIGDRINDQYPGDKDPAFYNIKCAKAFDSYVKTEHKAYKKMLRKMKRLEKVYNQADINNWNSSKKTVK